MRQRSSVDFEFKDLISFNLILSFARLSARQWFLTWHMHLQARLCQIAIKLANLGTLKVPMEAESANAFFTRSRIKIENPCAIYYTLWISWTCKIFAFSPLKKLYRNSKHVEGAAT